MTSRAMSVAEEYRASSFGESLAALGTAGASVKAISIVNDD